MIISNLLLCTHQVPGFIHKSCKNNTAWLIGGDATTTLLQNNELNIHYNDTFNYFCCQLQITRFFHHSYFKPTSHPKLTYRVFYIFELVLLAHFNERNRKESLQLLDNNKRHDSTRHPAKIVKYI